jgi:hypothetical protein
VAALQQLAIDVNSESVRQMWIEITSITIITNISNISNITNITNITNMSVAGLQRRSLQL